MRYRSEGNGNIPDKLKIDIVHMEGEKVEWHVRLYHGFDSDYSTGKTNSRMEALKQAERSIRKSLGI